MPKIPETVTEIAEHHMECSILLSYLVSKAGGTLDISGADIDAYLKEHTVLRMKVDADGAHVRIDTADSTMIPGVIYREAF